MFREKSLQSEYETQLYTCISAGKNYSRFAGVAISHNLTEETRARACTRANVTR